MEKLITLLTAIMLACTPLSAQNQSITKTADIHPGNPISGFLSKDYTEVLFNVIVPADGKVLFVFAASGDLQINNVTLRGMYNGEMKVRNSGPWGTAFTFEVNDLKAGTYTLSVPYWSGSGTFQASYSHVPINYEDPEPNDVYTSAVTVTDGSISEGHLGYSYIKNRDEADWYDFTTTLEGSVRFSLKTDGLLNVNNLVLYSLEGDELIARNTASWGTEFTFEVNDLKAGHYYLMIPRWSAYGSYVLTTSIIPNSVAIDAEPNNTIEQPISIQLNQSVTGHLGYFYSTYGDMDTQDWYVLTTTESGKLSINVTSEDPLRVNNLILIDQYGNAVLTTGTWGKEATVYKNNLLPGTYYIQVPRWSGYGAYTLSTSFVQAADADTEPNDIQNEAQVIQLSDTVYARIGYEKIGSIDQSDWFKVSIPESGILKFSIITDNTLAINNVLLYTENDNHRNTGNWGSQVTFTIDDLSKGDYWIKIPLWSGYGAYRFIAEFTPSLLPVETEPNDSYATAIPLIEGDTLSSAQLGYFHQSAQDKDVVDWYKFTVPQDGNASFIFKTTGDLSVNNPLLYASVGDSVSFRSSGPWGQTFTFNEYDLKAGEYYLKVPIWGGKGSYNILFTTNPCSKVNDMEPNNSFEQAIALPQTTVTGHIGYWHASTSDRDEVDWYKVTVPDEGKAIFTFKTSETLSLNNVSLHAAVGDTAIFRNSGPWTTDFSFIIQDLAKGDYYLRIPRWSGSGGYTLTYQAEPNTWANDAEPNNNFHKAVTVADKSVVTGHIGYYFDNTGNMDMEDWYKIPVNSTLTPTFTVICQSTLSINNPLLYAADGDSIRFLESSGGWGQTFVYTPTLNSYGYYYLKLPRWSGYGGYTLGINVNADSLITGNGDVISILPLDLKVSPNPATVQAVVTYNLPEEAMVTVNLVSLDGKVLPLVNERQAAGSQEIVINTSTLTAGTYLLSLKVGKQITSTILIVR
ncbi:MAG: T9SS type A sorting domain-containing protein [Bacteroidales bacterium]|nr:T9SS type A sorting domain-containing protein [Bacteroidales bacterium]